jgi:hypothetical protein
VRDSAAAAAAWTRTRGHDLPPRPTTVTGRRSRALTGNGSVTDIMMRQHHASSPGGRHAGRGTPRPLRDWHCQWPPGRAGPGGSELTVTCEGGGPSPPIINGLGFLCAGSRWAGRPRFDSRESLTRRLISIAESAAQARAGEAPAADRAHRAGGRDNGLRLRRAALGRPDSWEFGLCSTFRRVSRSRSRGPSH